MKRILFLKLGPYFSPTDISVREKYNMLSKEFNGDIIAVVNRKELKRITMAGFNLKGLYLPNKIRYSNMLRNIIYTFYTLIVSTYCHYYRDKYDIIITYDPFATGPLGLIISKLTGAKLIVEINGNYEKAFKLNNRTFKLIEAIKYYYVMNVIPFVLKHADAIKLVNHNQLKPFGKIKLKADVFVFPNFVPISYFKPTKVMEKYILFMGFPWHLKGVDILINAFNKICHQFPDYLLKIVGYCIDKSEYIKIAGGNTRVMLCDPVQYEEAIKLMSECSLFVLPSRTDSSPRVLREAMAAMKPIVASNVDGIPELIKHGFNGLLFESESVDDLADKIKTVLSNKELAMKIAQNGYDYVHANMSEECYVNNYRKIFKKVLGEE
ncbi:MAG: glycosyltransferase family 4 protein [Thermodesulfovibrionales bacterium]